MVPAQSSQTLLVPSVLNKCNWWWLGDEAIMIPQLCLVASITNEFTHSQISADIHESTDMGEMDLDLVFG